MIADDGDTSGHREFGGLDNDGKMSASIAVSVKGREEKLASLRAGIVGAYKLFKTPFNSSMKPIVYADWTASARCVRQIEDYIQHQVVPFYGNTHTTTSITGHQSTCFRHESRQIIAEAVNAKISGRAAEDVVIFTGNGTTSAVDKLVQALGMNSGFPDDVDPKLNRPVIFTTAYEHHSNLLPWRESCAEVVTIKYSPDTGVCLEDLAAKLIVHADRQVKISAMSAASNVTGIITDVDSVCILMHQSGGLAFFDYATAAPYVQMDMNPLHSTGMAYKDAIYFSGHKFLGGPGSPGVLITKRNVLPENNSLPSVAGGGTVFYVTEDHHRYLSNREEREEGGTPNVLGDVRIGLVMALKQSFDSSWIEQEEFRISKQIENRILECPELVLLGRSSTGNGQHLPIFSFLVRYGDYYLHHNFVCALLNDLFGVQARGGCQCAGPFSQQLLGLSKEANTRLETALLEKNEVLRPGFSRLSIPFWVSSIEIDYIVDALFFVAKHGFEFLPLYKFNHRTGEWAHSTRISRFPERKWLSHFNINDENGPEDVDTTNEKSMQTEEELSRVFQKLKQEAQMELELVQKTKKKNTKVDQDFKLLVSEKALRWFATASDSSVSDNSGTLHPIQPDPLFYEHQNSTDDDHQVEDSTPISTYAQQRDSKLRQSTGGGRLLPRYLQMFGLQSEIGAKITPKLSTNGKIMDSESKKIDKKQESAGNETKQEIKSDTCENGLCPPRNANQQPPVMKTMNLETVSNNELKRLNVPKKILKTVGQCIKDWDMIKEGDCLLLGLSGGKDSLTLLHVLLALQAKAPIKFSIACATIDPQTASYDPRPLIPYMKALGVEYHYISKPIIEMASTKLRGDSLCAFCARMKRGLLYSCCRENGYNKLVLGQHLDDLAESFLMSTLHNGQLRTMKANYLNDDGDIGVIRPLAYTREIQCRDFAREMRMPIVNENCPACFEQPKERARYKELLKQEEAMVNGLFGNFKNALMPLMDNSTYDTMKQVYQNVNDRSKIHSKVTKTSHSRTPPARDKEPVTKKPKFDKVVKMDSKD